MIKPHYDSDEGVREIIRLILEKPQYQRAVFLEADGNSFSRGIRHDAPIQLRVKVSSLSSFPFSITPLERPVDILINRVRQGRVTAESAKELTRAMSDVSYANHQQVNWCAFDDLIDLAELQARCEREEKVSDIDREFKVKKNPRGKFVVNRSESPSIPCKSWRLQYFAILDSGGYGWLSTEDLGYDGQTKQFDTEEEAVQVVREFEGCSV